MRIWTLEHTPFRLGTNWSPMCTDVPVIGPHKSGQANPTGYARGPYAIGPGRAAYVVIAPNGKSFVAESETGAFVGPDLKTVRKDMAEADPLIVKEQMKQAHAQVQGARYVEPDEFWRKLKCLKWPT